MLLRTKNFLLYLLSIAFLVLAIAATTVVNWQSTGGGAQASEKFVVGDDVAYSAITSTSTSLDRIARAATLRDKIAASGIATQFSQPSISETETDLPSESSGETTETVAAVAATGAIANCATYQPTTSLWNPTAVEFLVVEGARLVYREIQKPTIEMDASSSVPTKEKEVLLQLPLRTTPTGPPHCIPTDVVAIAMDGSLIRNNENKLYGVFGAETLIGYALDGFSVYGENTNVTVDVCGGAVVSGEYRYYVSATRESVLGCFAGQPVVI